MSEEIADIVRRDRENAASGTKLQPWMGLLPGVGESAAALYEDGDLLGAIAAIKEEMPHFPADSSSGLLLAQQLDIYEEIKRIEDDKRNAEEIELLRSNVSNVL